MRAVFPIIVILASVASFIFFTNPIFKEIQSRKAEAAQYNEALGNSKQLQSERDSLNDKYRAFPPAQVKRLETLLPDSADNIRLIIDLQGMARAYNMPISSIKFDTNQTTAPGAGSELAAGTPAEIAASLKDYGTFRLEFTTSATYDNFLKFLKDIESSLRLTDVESIDFSTDVQGSQNGVYTYTVKLRTYWLKR